MWHVEPLCFVEKSWVRRGKEVTRPMEYIMEYIMDYHIISWSAKFHINILCNEARDSITCSDWFCWRLPHFYPFLVPWVVPFQSMSGWWFQPLWKILINLDDLHYMGTYKMFQSTNQMSLFILSKSFKMSVLLAGTSMLFRTCVTWGSLLLSAVCLVYGHGGLVVYYSHFNYREFTNKPAWWFQRLWKILVNWNDYSQYMGK